MNKKHLILLLSAFPLIVPASRGTGLEGTYKNEAVTLSLNPSAAGYEGLLSVGGMQYSVNANAVGLNELQGNYQANGVNYPFQARVNGVAMNLTSQGQQFSLMKNIANVGPLAKAALRNAPAASPNTVASMQAETQNKEPGVVSQQAGALLSELLAIGREALTAEVRDSLGVGQTTTENPQHPGQSAPSSSPTHGGTSHPNGTSQGVAVGPTSGSPGGRQIVEPNAGVAFTPPPGWNCREADAGYILLHNQIPGMILMIAHEETSVQALASAAQQGITDASSGLSLRLKGAAQPFGQQGMEGNLEGTMEHQPAQAYAVGLITPYGWGGITILAATSSQQFGNVHVQAVRQLANSVQFSEPAE